LAPAILRALAVCVALKMLQQASKNVEVIVAKYMYLTYYVHLVGTKEVIGCNSLNSHDVFKNFTELNTQDLEHIVKKLNSGRKMA
jgi:hypothetical protein